MNEITFPTQSNATIIKASIIAMAMALVIFVSIILPAEYNIDPTGLGQSMGLTQLASVPPVEAVTANTQQKSVHDKTMGYQENTATIKVPANKGVEFKFKMQKFGNISYEWTTSGEPLYLDFHGEPAGDTSGYFESYTIATASEMKGSMTVPFDGVHGWYWKNNSNNDVSVTLKTQGSYEVVGLIH